MTYFQGNKYPISENFRNLVVTDREAANELLPLYVTIKPTALIVTNDPADGARLILKDEENNMKNYN